MYLISAKRNLNQIKTKIILKSTQILFLFLIKCIHPVKWPIIFSDKKEEAKKKRSASSTSYSTKTSTDSSSDIDISHVNESSAEDDSSFTSNSDDHNCIQNHFCVQSDDHLKPPTIVLPQHIIPLPKYNDKSLKSSGNNMPPEIHTLFAEADNESDFLDMVRV